MEMPNWTGYNAELLDELVEIGNELLIDNERKEVRIAELHKNWLLPDIMKIIVYVSIILFCIFGMITCTIK
jgi:hypothetical protein